jgi:hypothetical protein
MAQHIFAPVPAPSSIAPVTPQLEQFLLRALAKDPAQRFQSAEEMSATLQMAVPPGSFPHVNAPSQVPSRAPFAPVPAQQTTLSAANSARIAAASRKRGWIAPVVAVVGLVVGATAVVISQRGAGSANTAKAPEVASPAPEVHVRAPLPPAPETGTPQPPIPPATSPQVPPVPPSTPTPAVPAATPPTPPPLAPAPTPAAAKAPVQVTIKLASEPGGADVYRMPQGVRIGTTPLKHSMDAIEGEIVLIVKRRGYVDQQLAVPADRDTDQKITLVRVAAAKPHESEPPGRGAGSASPDPSHGRTLDPFDRLNSRPRQ